MRSAGRSRGGRERAPDSTPPEGDSASPGPRGGPARLGRIATFALPTVSALVATLVVLGPGALRPALGARLYGAPAEGARAVSLRVEVASTLYGTSVRAAASDLNVEATAPGQALAAWHGTTNADGVAEATLTAGAPVRGPIAVRVTAGGARHRLLAGGEIALGAPPPAVVGAGEVMGTTAGDLALRVIATRGLFAAPFPEVVRVSVSPPGRTELALSGPGLRTSPEKATTDERGEAAFDVEALAHEVELVVTARAGDKSARWEGTLPVVPGAMWLGPPPRGGGALALLSPAPREQAYVSFWTDEGRVAGAVVPLARDAQGFHAGEVAVPAVPGARLLYATVAGDPMEQGAGTAAWPIRPAEGAITERPIRLLFDGLPGAVAREDQRASWARRAGLVLVGAAALAEVLLLLLLARDSQRKLTAHLVEASAAMPEGDCARVIAAGHEHPALRALLAAALVGLAFAMVAALSTFR